MLKNRIILVLFCILLINLIPSAIAAIPNIHSMNSQNHFKFGEVSIQSKMMQSHRMDSEPSVSDLLHNFGKSDKVDPGLPYTAINEPIPVKCLLFSVNSPNVYSQKIDGYYYFPREGYIPHIKLTPIS
jgi:hypothetical protein